MTLSMPKKKSIGFFTIYLSRRYYLNEVPVEGKANSKFFRRLGMYKEYISQILRTGNCISLISTPITIEEESFWNTNHFEDLAKYVFWTFNRSFLLKLLANVEGQNSPLLLRCRELLLENPVAYNEPPPTDADDELLFCYRKYNSMKKYEYYAAVQALDKQNRKEFLGAVERRIAVLTNPLQRTTDSQTTKPPEATSEAPIADPPALVFLEMFRPMDGDPANTLRFIEAKTEEAGFTFKLFSPVTQLANGKNPYGFNGTAAAMIDFFYQHQYFKKEYSLEQIFGAYLRHSGNSIGKFKTFLSEFRNDRHYRQSFAKLKALKISKLH
jgi:hypothetical protein